jgi:hypothetical protein
MAGVATKAIRGNKRLRELSGFLYNYFSNSFMIEEGVTPRALAILNIVLILG